MTEQRYSLIVVGAGHAGCEAALAASRLGVRTALLTMQLDAIAAMSCNPAIGGLAKGQIVREIDALGGEMAWVTDNAGLQFRMLNRSRGPAVWSPRAQCDKKMYHLLMKHALEKQQNLDLLQAEVCDLMIDGGAVRGVITRTGARIAADAVILTTGTFLRGMIHVGLSHFPGGRIGEFPAEPLGAALAASGLTVKRLKTGTPPRINGTTIDRDRMAIQPGDEPPVPFSHFTAARAWQATRTQLPCWLTYTNPTTHDIIRRSLDRSPLYTGVIKSTGPRYCPSIEDKIVRFAERERHQVFLEPEGYSTEEMYANGISTSLPEDTQEALVHSIPGMEHAKIMRYGYAIEYDYCPPDQLQHTLETKTIGCLYLAGQINGTTGYEEAAAQGLMAGINAARKLTGKEPFILRRDEAYIGVLIDDLVLKGVDEPYRMFTSRAEYRLALRTDNADLRLMDHGRHIGLISDTMYRKFDRYRDAVRRLTEDAAAELPADRALEPWSDEQAAATAAIERKYAGYIERQNLSVQKLRRMETKHLPADFNFDQVPSLLTETRQKLSRVRPSTLGQAARVPGVTPADIALLAVHLERRKAAKKNGA